MASPPDRPFDGRLHHNVLDMSGAPGGPTVNGVAGEPGLAGAASTDSCAGHDGYAGKPGAPGFAGLNGSDGRAISLFLSDSSDDAHMRIALGQHASEIQVPLIIRTNGGTGGTGGSGGSGGMGGAGGDGCRYLAHNARSSYRWELVGGYGFGLQDVKGQSSSQQQPSKQASKRMSASPGQFSPADVRAQAGPSAAIIPNHPSGQIQIDSSDAQNAYFASLPPGVPNVSRKKKVVQYMEHMAWDDSLWRAAICEDGVSFILIRNAHTSIGNALHIVDWTGTRWIVSIERPATFVYSPPDPSAPNARQPFKAGVLQYIDWYSTPCEVKIQETEIDGVVKLSNGGNGGQGGPGGHGGPGGNGGNAGNIQLMASNPILFLNLKTETFGGNGGNGGAPGLGGKGGAGGHGFIGGLQGSEGISGIPGADGVTGKSGTVEYVRVDAQGGVIQRGFKKPELKLVSLELKCLNGSAILETNEKARLSATFVNCGDISIPPNSVVALSNSVNFLFSETAVLNQWLEPGVEFKVDLLVHLGLQSSKASSDMSCTLQGRTLYSSNHQFSDLQHPFAISTVVNAPHVTFNQSFGVGAILNNLSGLASGRIHNRPITVQISLEPGMVFIGNDSNSDRFSPDKTQCESFIEDFSAQPMTFEQKVMLDPTISPFSSRGWQLKLFWRGNPIGEITGKVKMIPSFNPTAVPNADTLLITHPGFTATSYSRLMQMINFYKLTPVTWDYYYHKDVQTGNSFKPKCIIFCLRDAADIELLGSDQIFHHFFAEDGSDSDSSLLVLSPDPQETISLLNRRLVTIGHQATDEEMTRKFFGKPNSKDFQEVVKDVERDWFPQFPDYYVWSVSQEDPVKISDGVRSKWKLGSVNVMKATLSYLHRFYVMDCNFVVNDTLSQKEMAALDTALRHSLTLAHKVFLIETDSRSGSLEATEASLYYDLKTEFFFIPRPLLFLKQLTDLLFQFTYRYATARIVESVFRLMYRLKQATYWKSFGLSDFKPKYVELENQIKKLKESLMEWSNGYQHTDPSRKLDMRAIDERAIAGAKASNRVKWRKHPLPFRLREIPEKEEISRIPPPGHPTDGSFVPTPGVLPISPAVTVSMVASNAAPPAMPHRPSVTTLSGPPAASGAIASPTQAPQSPQLLQSSSSSSSLNSSQTLPSTIPYQSAADGQQPSSSGSAAAVGFVATAAAAPGTPQQQFPSGSSTLTSPSPVSYDLSSSSSPQQPLQQASPSSNDSAVSDSSSVGQLQTPPNALPLFIPSNSAPKSSSTDAVVGSAAPSNSDFNDALHPVGHLPVSSDANAVLIPSSSSSSNTFVSGSTLQIELPPAPPSVPEGGDSESEDGLA